jgi:hypothetical protein
MKKTIILQILFCFCIYQTFSQETNIKDSVKNNFGVTIEVGKGLSNSFREYGLDYNYIINSRFSFGLAGSLINNRKADYYVHGHFKYLMLNSMAYLRVDTYRQKFSPFIDLGIGYYNLTLKYDSFINYNEEYNGLFFSTRIGFYLINIENFNLALMAKFKITNKNGTFYGLGLICSLKK